MRVKRIVEDGIENFKMCIQTCLQFITLSSLEAYNLSELDAF